MPETVLPVEAGIAFVLARTQAAVVAVGGVRSYPHGFEFEVTAMLRDRPRYASLLKAITDPISAEATGMTDFFLRIGLRFADGTVVTNASASAYPDEPSRPRGRVFLFNGGGGNGRLFRMRFWTWPLPPDGPLLFVCEWPAFNVPESGVEVDSHAILDAAGRAFEPWS
jgi:hypothetical protein